MQNENFLEKTPKEFIKEEYLSEYEEKRNIIWKNLLIPLRMNLFVLEKLLNFPYKIIDYKEFAFFKLLIYNFKRMSILGMWKIMEDTDQKSITLTKFRNSVFLNIKQEYKEDLKKKLGEINRIEKNIRSKIKKLRHKEIAHLDENYVLSPEKEVITVREITESWKLIRELFDLLCFGHRYESLPLEFTGEKTGVDEFLNFLAINSQNFNLPESNPKAWKIFRSKLSREDIEKINEYRVKNGKDPVE